MNDISKKLFWTPMLKRQFQYCHRAATRSRRGQLKLVLDTRKLENFGLSASTPPPGGQGGPF